MQKKVLTELQPETSFQAFIAKDYTWECFATLVISELKPEVHFGAGHCFYNTYQASLLAACRLYSNQPAAGISVESPRQRCRRSQRAFVSDLICCGLSDRSLASQITSGMFMAVWKWAAITCREPRTASATASHKRRCHLCMRIEEFCGLQETICMSSCR